MKTKNIAVFGLLIFSMISVFQIQAQVTIGSNLAPRKGALLDVKGDIASDPVNLTDTTAQRGILLPRVQLVDKTSLLPMLTGAAATDPLEKRKHVGLTVYNLTQNQYFIQGLYTWSGDAWLLQGNNYSPLLQGDKTSNSFIVNSSNGLDIPIYKAYDFWENYSSPPFAAFPFVNSTLSEDSQDITAELLWMDQPGLITNAEIDNKLPIVGLGKDAKIRVFPVIGSTVSGNAIVVVRIKGSDNAMDPDDPTKYPIRWSWHLWFTNYDPNKDSLGNPIDVTALGETTVMNGSVYRYNNTSHPDGNYVFMDRDLGAYNATFGDAGSTGCYYQWGRKDPFPGASLVTKNLRPVYNMTNGNTPLTEDKSGGTSMIKRATVPTSSDGDNNLANAVKRPYIYYTVPTTAVGGGTSLSDWYTNRGQISQAWLNYVNDFLWDDNGQKSIFDPCPAGWRVPPFKNGRSPWFYGKALTTATSTSDVNNVVNYPQSYTSNVGTIFQTDYNVGYYSLSGYRTGTGTDGDGTNIHEGVRHTGGRWVSTGAENEYTVYAFTISDGTPSAKTNPEDSPSKRRATGYTVRCIQE